MMYLHFVDEPSEVGEVLLIVKPEEPENIKKIVVVLEPVEGKPIKKVIDEPTDVNDLLEPFTEVSQPVKLKKIKIIVKKT